MKRTYDDIRLKILKCLLKNKRTINDIAVKTNINWRTVRKHLVFLRNKKLVDEIFTSPYARIFKISEKGKGLVQK